MRATEQVVEYKDIFATNYASKFGDWSIKLRNGATLTGIAYIPPSGPVDTAIERPLLVGIHGASCSAYTYDTGPSYTASKYSECLDVPFVAFNRPNYLGSSGWIIDRASHIPNEPQYKSLKDATYFQEEGRWFHELIFPALWEKFAIPNRCGSLVTTSHSMALPATIFASASYSRDPSAAGYTWAGMVLSGLGEVRTQHSIVVSGKLKTNKYNASQLPYGHDPNIHEPPYYQGDKEDLMLGKAGVSRHHLRPLVWKQNTPSLIGEVLDLVGTWP